MIHEVEVYAHDRGKDVKHTITYDDESKRLTLDPPGDPMLRSILTDELRLAGNKRITFADEPVRFLENLHRQYRSYALNATPCVSLPSKVSGANKVTNQYTTYEIPLAEDVE